MSEPKRYVWGVNGMLVPILQKHGDYVLYSDYSALQAENERLKADAKYYAELHEPQHRQALEERDQFKAQLHSAEQHVAVLTEKLENMIRIAEHCAPAPSHDGPCGPWNTCDGSCIDAANCAAMIHDARAALSHGEQP